MKLWNLTTFLSVLILTFSGCLDKTPKPKVLVDTTLPIVTLTSNGVFTDMKAVGFEWNSVMQDPRVEGIYVYKKAVDSKEKSNAFYDTINNRFVTHYLDENVKPGTAYSYVFKTFTKESESVASNEFIATTLEALKSVSWIYVTQEMPRSAKVLWRPHTNEIVQNYIIERRTLADDTWKKLALVKGRLNAEYIDLNLQDSHVYKYRIRAVTYNDITSAPSEEVKVLTKALPKSVENIVASNNLAKQIKLTWNKTSIKDFATYNVYRSSNLNGNFSGNYDLVLQTKSTEYIDTIDEDGKDYFYRVSAVDTDKLESIHHIKSIHGKTLAKPTTPSLVGVKLVGTSLQINWKSTDPRVKSFIVEKTIKKSWVDTAKEEFVDIKDMAFVDTKIEPNTTYYYKIYSVDTFSIRSLASMEVRFETNSKQGKKIPKEVIKDQVKEVIEFEEVPEVKNVVIPVDDLSVSGL